MSKQTKEYARVSPGIWIMTLKVNGKAVAVLTTEVTFSGKDGVKRTWRAV